MLREKGITATRTKEISESSLKVAEVLLSEALRKKILEARGITQTSHSFLMWGKSPLFPSSRLTDLKSNNGRPGFMEEVFGNQKEANKRPIAAVVVLREIQREILIPTKEDLEALNQVTQLPYSREVTLVEVGFRPGEPNIEFLIMKPKEDYGLRNRREEIERLTRILPKRKTQDQVTFDISQSGLLVVNYSIPAERFSRTKTLKKDYKFAR